jgi:hypothetical protein
MSRVLQVEQRVARHDTGAVETSDPVGRMRIVPPQGM